MPKASYYQKVEIMRNEKIRRLCQELPAVCLDFFSGISQTTSSLTRLAYAYDLRLFFHFLCSEQPDFANVQPNLISIDQIGMITPRQLREYQDYLTQYIKEGEDVEDTVVLNHELGIMRKLCAIRSLFEFLFENELIPANIATLVPLPKRHQKPILYLTDDEVKKILETAQNGSDTFSDHCRKIQAHTSLRDTAILALFLGTGIRVSELVGIDIPDVDFDQNAFLVTRKGGNQSILYFPESVAEALKRYLEERNQVEPLPGNENALFLSLQRKRITQRAVEKLVKKYAAVAAPLKKKMSPHKLRSTFGTSLYRETGDIYLVADVLGHSDVNTTKRHYAAMSDQRRREAAKKINIPAPDQKEETTEDSK